jgi:hypothetical protein
MVVMFRGQQKTELTGGTAIGSAVASLAASLVEERVLERLNAAMHGKVDNVFISMQSATRQGDRQRTGGVGEAVRIYAFRESHPHKIYFAEN